MRIKKFLSAKCPVWSGICHVDDAAGCIAASLLWEEEVVRAEHGLSFLWFFWTADRRLPPPAEQSLTDPANSNHFACSGGGMRQCAGYLYE